MATEIQKAQNYIPGGVNSPVRALRVLDMDPIFVERGKGCRFYDTLGREYIDYMGSWGPLILGHAHPRVVDALKKAVEKGTSFGAATTKETQLAQMVVEAVPGMEMVRLVSSGTEAVMSALRLARAITGRDKIVKFAGCYHGHFDSLLIKAGSGVFSLGLPDSPGVTKGTAGDTLAAPFNDLEAVEAIFKDLGSEIAAVILEPVAGNMGLVPPEPGYLEGLRKITRDYGTLLIFDEVMTGFRVSYGGAQERYGVTPDLTCLGKIIGGGLPAAAFGGSKKIMENVAPAGPVYQAGTLAGNPLAVTAAIETLKELKQPGVYEQLEERSQRLEQGLKKSAQQNRVDVQINRVGSMFTVYFTSRKVKNLETVSMSDKQRFKVFYKKLLEKGVYLSPSPYEASFVSLAHQEEDINYTVKSSREAFACAAEVK